MSDYNELEAMRSYTEKVRDLLVKTYQFAYRMYILVPSIYKPVEDAQHMNELYDAARELGIEIDL